MKILLKNLRKVIENETKGTLENLMISHKGKVVNSPQGIH